MTPEQIARLINEDPNDYSDLPDDDQFGADLEEIKRTGRYGNYSINYHHGHWLFCHDDFDGGPSEVGGPPIDNRCGSANSLKEVVELIDEIEYENLNESYDHLPKDNGEYSPIIEYYDDLPDEDEFVELNGDWQACIGCGEATEYLCRECSAPVCGYCDVAVDDHNDQCDMICKNCITRVAIKESHNGLSEDPLNSPGLYK